MGGTFDHLHDGHKFLIKTALLFSENLVIGLTTEKLLKNKKVASKLETYETRKNNLKEFIRTIADINRVQIIELNDIYGPPINEPEYDGLIVSQETYNVGVKINEIRESNGLKPLIIIVIPIVKDKNNQKISSTLIREQLLR